MGDFKGGGRDFGPREMHDATCADCGNECQVPFKPAEDKPVYCRDCYRKRRKF
ncbi:CxxC-x17-CxxC domain-containing protein [Nanoarchaeota archaeon]